jgi:dihydrofolate synthase/folylpolyglutamate synthase
MAKRTRFEGPDDVFQALLPFANVEKGQDIGRFRLDRMEALCRLLGNPERSFRSIHAAGSKGKGSVCAMMAAILEASGRKTGIYASPHVYDWRERVTTPSGPFPDEAYLEAGEALMEVVDRWTGDASLESLGMPTFFELMTALAFLVFRSQGCSWAVVETGLGGRLDSTNVIVPEASVITPIELEHTEYLGDSIPLIAAEKAGIIKAGRPVFLSSLRPEARRVMEEAAALRGSPLETIEEACEISDAVHSLAGEEATLRVRKASGPGERVLRVRTAMAGEAMLQNAALAVLCLDRIVGGLEDEAIVSGLALARLHARFEVLRQEPSWSWTAPIPPIRPASWRGPGPPAPGGSQPSSSSAAPWTRTRPAWPPSSLPASAGSW